MLRRLKLRHGLNPAEIEDLVDILAIQAELIEPLAGVEPGLPDAADQPGLGALLAAGKTSGVVCLITGDKDLPALAAGYPMVTPHNSGKRMPGCDAAVPPAPTFLHASGCIRPASQARKASLRSTPQR